jgi:hypothetical protein
MRTTVINLFVMVLSMAALAEAQSPSTGTQPGQQGATPELKLDIPIVPATPERRQFGIFTLEPPQTNGQIVAIGVPIGELAVRAVGSVKRAQHRRAERRARTQVQKELQDFLAKHSEIKN